MPVDFNEKKIRDDFNNTLKGFTAVLTSALQDLRKAKISTGNLHSQMQSMAAQVVETRSLRGSRQQNLLNQINYPKLFGERLAFMGKLADIEIQIQKTEKVLGQKSLNPVFRNAEKQKLDNLKSQRNFQTSLLEMTDSQIQKYENLVKADKDLTSGQREYLDSVISVAKAEAELTHASNSNRQLIYSQVQLGRERVLRAQQYLVAETAVARQQKFNAKMENIFGFSFESLKSKYEDLRDIITDPATLLVTAVDALRITLAKLNEIRLQMHATAFQAFGAVGPALGSFGQVFSQGILTAPTEAAHAAANLTVAYGSMRFLSSQLIADQLRLTKIYGLSGDEAAHVVHMLDFMSNRSNIVRENTMDFVKALAKANQIPIGVLFQDISHYSETFARFGIEGAKAFANAAASSRLIGVSLDKIDTLADTALSAQSFIEKTATLNTFLARYGVFLDPAKIIYYAQTNQLDKIQTMLKTQLGGMNLAMLSKDRITMNQLMGLGLSAEDIQNIIHGSRISGTTVTQPKRGQFGTDIMDNLISSLENLAGVLSGVTHALTFLTAVIGAQAIMGGRLGAGLFAGVLSKIPFVSRLFGPAVGTAEGLSTTALGTSVGGGMLASLLPFGTKALRGVGMLGGGISVGMGAFDIGKTALQHGNIGKALERHLFTGILGAVGGILAGIGTLGVGAPEGALIGAGIGGIVDQMLGLGKETVKAQQDTQDAMNMGGVESRLDKLINIFQDGTVAVRMDGKKVGSLAFAPYI